MIRLLMPGGKVLFTHSKKKIKAALKKGAKKITKKESDKRLDIAERKLQK